MSSSFKGQNLFGSGPHRFALGRQGHLVLGELYFGSIDPGSFAYGLLELDVIVTGRLVASTEAQLWTLRDAIVDALEEFPTPGTLIDLHARSWADMTFIRFDQAEQVDRGRLRSLAYTATFRRFRTPADEPAELPAPSPDPV